MFYLKSQFFIFFINQKKVYQMFKANYLFIYLKSINHPKIYLFFNILFRTFILLDKI